MTNTRKIYLNTNNDKLASQSSVRSGLVLPFENVDVLLVDEHLLPLGTQQLQHLGDLGEGEGG